MENQDWKTYGNVYDFTGIENEVDEITRVGVGDSNKLADFFSRLNYSTDYYKTVGSVVYFDRDMN